MVVPQIFTTYSKETLLLILDGLLSENQRLNAENDRLNEFIKKLSVEKEELKWAGERIGNVKICRLGTKINLRVV